jgi:acetyltransferase-like isoleucine patch superfamily enzyme
MSATLQAEERATVDVRAWNGSRILKYVSAQLRHIHPCLWLAQLLVCCIPICAFGNVRSALYRLAGFTGIAAKVYIFGMLDLRGPDDIYSRLHVGEHSQINAPCFMELSAPVHIGERVSIGHHFVLATTDHEVGPAWQRCGDVMSKPVVIGDGSWLGARVTVVPGVTIGQGAVVSIGAVVTRDVPPGAKVAGNPARVIGWLDRPGGGDGA